MLCFFHIARLTILNLNLKSLSIRYLSLSLMHLSVMLYRIFFFMCSDVTFIMLLHLQNLFLASFGFRQFGDFFVSCYSFALVYNFFLSYTVIQCLFDLSCVSLVSIKLSFSLTLRLVVLFSV